MIAILEVTWRTPLRCDTISLNTDIPKVLNTYALNSSMHFAKGSSYAKTPVNLSY